MKKKYKKYLQELIELQNETDVEIAHVKADDVLTNLLRDLGYEEIVEAYNKINMWYA